MKKTYRIKKHAKNAFEAETGLKTITLSGLHNCIITENKTHKGVPIHNISYMVKNDLKIYNKGLTIATSCGINQCVHPDHLEIQKYTVTTQELEYINDYLKIDGIEAVSKKIGITPKDLTSWLAHQE